ncbi:hypothetical protein GEMRC1_002123 [Eukaryota sp. GEM-RC1]
MLSESKKLKNSNYSLSLSPRHQNLFDLIDSCYLLRKGKSEQNLKKPTFALNFNFNSILISIHGYPNVSGIENFSEVVKSIPFLGNLKFLSSDIVSVTLERPKLTFQVFDPLSPKVFNFSISRISANSCIHSKNFQILSCPTQSISSDLGALSCEILILNGEYSVHFQISPFSVSVSDELIEFLLVFYRCLNLSRKSESSHTDDSEDSPSKLSRLKISSIILNFSWIPSRNIVNSVSHVFSTGSLFELINSFAIYDLEIAFKPFEKLKNFGEEASFHYAPTRTHVMNLMKAFSLLGRLRTFLTSSDDVVGIIDGNQPEGLVSSTCNAFLTVWTGFLNLLRKR